MAFPYTFYFPKKNVCPIIVLSISNNITTIAIVISHLHNRRHLHSVKFTATLRYRKVWVDFTEEERVGTTQLLTLENLHRRGEENIQ